VKPEKVWLVIDSTFDVGGKEETSLTLYTEGEMTRDDDHYTYRYDESHMYDAPTTIKSMLEVGENFVRRTLSGDLNYVMHFEVGKIDSVLYQSAGASFMTQIETVEFNNNVIEGLGEVDFLYKISFAMGQSMINRIAVRITGDKA
jgi:uncharacterized beta-barrel protein YwiB (DUF1934 family)